ncbi:hypothetical protein DJ73_01455 [Halorubrum sp. Ea1]|nr:MULTISPECIES: hypothetical protein [unclassified Halorubrum]OYR44058.1 hypothetical protein DJ75_10310 [Halorubrum sp. Eb13]OYR55848.1 hypothetical protein DJ73_01455 [Halorubrum sp. Ea1]
MQFEPGVQLTRIQSLTASKSNVLERGFERDSFDVFECECRFNSPMLLTTEDPSTPFENLAPSSAVKQTT